MKELRQLVEYVTPTRLRRLSFLRASGKDPETQLKKLYSVIADGEVRTDESASQVLFKQPKDKRYPRLKYRLKQQLVNTVLLVDDYDKPGKEYDLVFADLRKRLYVADIMRRQGAYSIVYDLVNKVLTKSLQADMTAISLHGTQLMLAYYLFGKPRPKKRQYYADLARHLNKVQQAEIEAQASYYEMMNHIFDPRISTEDKIASAEASIRKLDREFPGISSTAYDDFYNTIRIIAKASAADYEAVKQICRKQIEKLEAKAIYPRGHVRNYLFQLIYVSLPTQDFQTGKMAFEQLVSMVDEGVRPWFRAQQLYVYLAIHTEEYALGMEVCNNILRHRKFKRQQSTIQERFILLRAYLYWLNAIGLIDSANGRSTKFRIGKFINETPEFSKEKRRFNIPILVIQLLWLITQRNYVKAYERLVALDRYAERNLRYSPGMVRTYYFLKVLAQLRAAQFHQEAFRRKSARYLKSLHKFPSSSNAEAIEIEIIPYERLYELIIEQLDLQLH